MNIMPKYAYRACRGAALRVHFGWQTWKCLNRLRTGMALTKSALKKWGLFEPTGNTQCEWTGRGYDKPLIKMSASGRTLLRHRPYRVQRTSEVMRCQIGNNNMTKDSNSSAHIISFGAYGLSCG